MSKNKKFISILTSIFIIAGLILFLLRKNNVKKDIWLLTTFQGDNDNNFSDNLLKEIKILLPPSSKITLREISKEINDNQQATKELKRLHAKLIIWGRMENEKALLQLTISKPSSNYISINNSIACLLNLKNIELIDELKNFTYDNKSLIKNFLRGYIKYLNREYKAAISIWENNFPNNSIISFYLGNAYLMLSQKGKQVKNNHLKAREYYQNTLSTTDKTKNLLFFQSILNNLGIHYLDYPFNLNKENLVKAQNYLKEAVTISPDWSNEEYGIALNNLAIVYENINYTEEEKFNKLVIKNLIEIIRVFRESKNKEMQAIAYNNLVVNYIKRKNGSKENVEEAIDNLKLAKKLISKEYQPEIFYRIINNLGVTHSYQKKTKEALKYFAMSEPFFSQNNYRKESAIIHKNIGMLYLLSPDRENVILAIKNFQNALEFFKEDEYPMQFGLTQETLGNILSNITRAPDESNLIEAIKCYENALRVINEDNLPVNFAHINSNLGLIYSSIKYNKRLDNLKKAVICYENALLVFKKDIYPFQYANLKNNLGNIFSDLSVLNENNSSKETTKLLESAINYFNEALEIYQQFGNIRELIMTKVNLANIYTLIPHEKKKNLNKAISIYKDVLSSPDSMDYYNMVRHNMEVTKKALQNLK